MIEGLTAEDGLDFDAGEGVLKPPGGGLGLGILNVAAPIEGDDGAGDGVGGKDGAVGHVVDVVADGGKDAVEKADDVSQRNGLAVHYCVAVGGGDFHGVEVLDGVFHGLQDLGLGDLGDVGEQRGNALGLVAGWDDVEADIGYGGGLAGGEDDVGVVGEDYDVFRAGGPGSLQQFLGAGVHGALAGNYGVTAEVVKEVNEPFSPGYGDDGEGRDVLLPGVEGEEPLVLLADVVHLNANGASKGGAVGNDLVGFEGVDVHLGEGGVSDDYEGAAFFGEVASKGGHVYVYAFNHELGAETVLLGVGGFKELLADGGHAGVGWRGEFYFKGVWVLVQEGAEKALHDDDDALTTGVYDAGVSEHREHRWSLSEGVFGFVEGAVPKVKDAFVGGGPVGSTLSEAAKDGEHGTFDGLGDGGVAGLGAGGEGISEGSRVGGLDVLEALGESGKELREDDAAVAAGTEEGAAGGFLGDGGEGGGVYGLQAGIHGLHGEEHVGAGVAIGNGEDVEGVNDVAVPLKATGSCVQGGFQPVAIKVVQIIAGRARGIAP